MTGRRAHAQDASDRSGTDARGTSSSLLEAPRFWVLASAALLALASLLWSVFLWIKFADAQSGIAVTCSLGGSTSCTALWDSGFARTVHLWSRLPVAGWGVLWSNVALLLALGAWVLRAEPRLPLWPATVCTAIAGLAGVFGLLAVSAALRTFCFDCAVIYLLVGGYGALVAREAFRLGPRPLPRGAFAAAIAAGLSYLILLYPAARTPFAADRSRLAVSASAATSGDSALADLLKALGPAGRQQLANALAAYRSSEARPMRPARGLIGSEHAPLRLTDFADLLCSHCAELHAVLREIRARVPADSFALEPRFFPLDGRCNPLLDPAPGEPTRCVAAKAMICVAGRPEALALADQLYEEQSKLTPERVYELGAKIAPGVDLRSCVDSAETGAKLSEDIAWATEHHIQGTPMVLLNGKLVPALPPVLYALILAGGDAQHRLFIEQLPPASN